MTTISTFKDRVTGVKIRQLTSYLGHSNHTYFTNNGWWDNNRRLLIQSDRNNATNIYSIEIETGQISRLTDFPANCKDHFHFSNDVNPVKAESYFIRNNTLYALNLETLEQRKLYEAANGFDLHGGLVNADGKYVYASLKEDLSDRVYANLSASYVGMRETFEAKPDTRILKIDTEVGGAEEVWQDNCWIGHINPSPKHPNIISFCHEGPWSLVENRIWVLDVDEGTPYKVRPREEEGEKIGHEYWFRNGEQIGYQVHKVDGTSCFGAINYDNTEKREASCMPLPSPDHIHSNDFSLIVSDSGKSIKLYRFNGTDFDDARILCMHDGSFFYGSHHPHPRFTADGHHLLFNSNQSGYCNLYLVEVPKDVSQLPVLE